MAGPPARPIALSALPQPLSTEPSLSEPAPPHPPSGHLNPV